MTFMVHVIQRPCVTKSVLIRRRKLGLVESIPDNLQFAVNNT